MRKLCVITLLALAACARHESLPPALKVMEPPVPTNVSVETVDYVTFHLSWEVDDPSVVSYYRLYWKSAFSAVAPLDTTVHTSAQVTTEGGLPVHGIIFCVSSVTTENVESRLVCVPAE
jgi:hypothetical protein